jgi:hypothetical protein
VMKVLLQKPVEAAQLMRTFQGEKG